MLAESLWESLGDPFEVPAGSEDAVAVLALERDRQLEAGEVQPVSHQVRPFMASADRAGRGRPVRAGGRSPHPEGPDVPLPVVRGQPFRA